MSGRDTEKLGTDRTVLADSRAALETDRTIAADSGAALGTDRTALAESRPASAAAPAPGGDFGVRPFGPYTRLEQLGQQGNMGVVARGYNHAFGRWELLKFLKPELLHEPELLRQFRREGRALARLSHPNVVQVFAMYDVDAQPCIAMEFLDGLSLSAELERAGGRLPQERAQELLLDAARGLSAAHDLGLLHRDIKPDNLFVTLPGKGRVAGLKLIDFGLATADKARAEVLQQDPSLASDATGGTPLFLAPEIWRGRDPTPLSDLYALGMSFYFAVTGRYPFKDTGLPSVISYCASPEPAPPVSRERPDLAPAFCALLDRLIDKRPERRLESADKLVTELLALRASSRPRRVPGVGPYRGLLVYSESERDVFFGREREIAEITERLRTQQALILVGPAACGKSSLLRAGVVPALRDGVLGGSIGFEAVILAELASPLSELAAQLGPLLQTPEAELLAQLRAAPGDLRALVERKLTPERGLVLVVDQLEQLAQVAPDEAQRFALALSSLSQVESPRLRLLASARSDVVDRLFALEPLRGLLTRGFQPVLALTGAELSSALHEPAKTAGYNVEDPAIFDEVAASIEGAAAGLALASLTLHRYYQLRDEPNRLLTRTAWERLGGVTGALIEHADAVWESLSQAERAAAGELLLRLISSSGKRDSARRETLVDPLSGGAIAAQALERLLAARLCVEVAGEVELVHDALATTWPRAKELLASKGADQQLRKRVSQAASQWEEQQRPDGLLWTGEQAERLLHWFEGAEQSFSLLELEFVDAVRKQRRLRRNLRRVGAGVAITLGVLLCSWLVVREERLSQEVERQRTRLATTEAEHRAEAARLYADRAWFRLGRDPAGALRDAQAAGRLRPDPTLDALAWQAGWLGVPSALPPHPGGAGWVASDGEYVITTGTDSLHSLRVRGAGSGSVALPTGPGGKPLGVSALVLAADAWLGTLDGRVLRASYAVTSHAPTPEPLALSLVMQTDGAVRELWNRDQPSRLFALVSKPQDGELALHALPNGEELWHGPARDAALDETGQRLLWVTPSGAVQLAELDKPTESHGLTYEHATAVAWVGKSAIAGDDHGRLLHLPLASEEKPAGAAQHATPEKPEKSPENSLGGPIRRLLIAKNQRCVVAQTESGTAGVFGPNLEEHARLRAGSPSVQFLDAWRAVALVDEHQEVVVLGCDSGLELARLRGAGDFVTSLGAAEGWLLVSALDGGVRAFDLTSSLPKLLPPLAGPTGAVRSTAAAAGACAAFGSEAAELAPSGAGTRKELPLSAQQGPGANGLLAAGAGIAWTRGSEDFGFWDGQQLSLGSAARPIERLLVLAARPELVLAQASGRAGHSELVRTKQGNLEQAVSDVPGPVLALAEIDSGFIAVWPSSGPLVLVSAPGGPVTDRIELPGGARSAALAVTAERYAVGYRDGAIAVGALSGGKPRMYRVGSGAVTGLSFGRDERLLIAGTAQGEAWALDLDTARAFPLFATKSGPLECGFDAARERYVFAASDGSRLSLALDTTPLSFRPSVTDPLAANTSPDAAAQSLAQWRGLEPADADDRARPR